jgi:hypothetical protein
MEVADRHSVNNAAVAAIIQQPCFMIKSFSSNPELNYIATGSREEKSRLPG